MRHGAASAAVGGDVPVDGGAPEDAGTGAPADGDGVAVAPIAVCVPSAGGLLPTASR